MTVELRLIEMLALDVKPHPNEVKKGDFAYWNNLASLIGIDLAEETAINDEQQVSIQLCEVFSPILEKYVCRLSL